MEWSGSGMGLSMVHGRAFQPSDDAPGAPPVMVVSRAMARAFWPDQPAVGRCVLFQEDGEPEPPCTTVVGVVSVTDISSDGTRNVLPTTATLRGDVRSYLPSVQADLERVMERIVRGVCSAHGAEFEFSYTHDFVPTINSEAETDAAIAAARRAFGEDNVITDIRPATTSEDFARMLQVKPGCYALIGNGGMDAGGCGLHNPNYDFNDEILPVGAAFWVSLVEMQFPLTG